jgi:hypothetical protein
MPDGQLGHNGGGEFQVMVSARLYMAVSKI